MTNKQIISNIHQICNKKHLSIATCESITIGNVFANLAKIPGSSQICKGSIIAYQNEIKSKLLHINDLEIISTECAQAMALKASELLNADFTIATTGNAGPSSLEQKAVGLVFISIYEKKINKFYNLKLQLWSISRQYITKKSTTEAIRFLYQVLK